MLESPAWRAMPGHAIKVVMRIALEHLKHGGVENGGLPTTYNDFVSCGVRRARIREAIMIAIYLGWIERVSIGETPWHGDIREPSKLRGRHGGPWRHGGGGLVHPDADDGGCRHRLDQARHESGAGGDIWPRGHHVDLAEARRRTFPIVERADRTSRRIAE